MLMQVSLVGGSAVTGLSLQYPTEKYTGSFFFILVNEEDNADDKVRHNKI